LPFLAWAIAPALRRAPATVSALAFVSAGAMAVATAAEPLLQDDDTHHWIARIVDGNFAATIVSLSGVGHGWIAILPFFFFVLVAIVATALATRPRLTRHDLLTAPAAVVAWIVVEHGAPELLRVDRLVHQSWGTLAAVVLAAVAAWAVIGRRLEGLLLLPFATVRFDVHTKFALLLAVLPAAVMGFRGRVLRSA